LYASSSIDAGSNQSREDSVPSSHADNANEQDAASGDLSLDSNTDIGVLLLHNDPSKASNPPASNDKARNNLINVENTAIEREDTLPANARRVLLLYLNRDISLVEESTTVDIGKMVKIKGSVSSSSTSKILRKVEAASKKLPFPFTPEMNFVRLASSHSAKDGGYKCEGTKIRHAEKV